MKKIVFILYFLPLLSFSQPVVLPLSSDYEYFIRNYLFESDTFHSSVKPFVVNDFNESAALDSFFRLSKQVDWKQNNKVTRSIFLRHQLELNKKDYTLHFDFLPDWQGGKDFSSGKSTYLNSRGFFLEGNIGKNFSFRSDFYENQGAYAGYIEDYGKLHKVVPGQGLVHTFLAPGFDFNNASGLISYSGSKYFNVQFGHGKNFWGDGYRSTLLSDVAYNYPFLKITTDFWKIKYVNLFAQFQDLRATPLAPDVGFRKKYATFHYLDFKINKRFSLGLFEAVIWKADDTGANRGFDVNYLNPIIFYRPVEFSLGSPDNELLGINSSYKISSENMLYGQFLLDELKFSEYIHNRGWWANKYAYQLGIKSYKLAGIKRLYGQIEINGASPYTYSERSTLMNYGHDNESLAHPLGANFREFVSIIRYQWNRIEYRLQWNYDWYGKDSSLTQNIGQDIFKSYSTRQNEYGNFTGQGLKVNLSYVDLRLSYLLNPKNNLRIELGYVRRDEWSAGKDAQTSWVTFGLRSSFRNLYYDF